MAELGDRLTGLGINPDDIEPSPDGTGETIDPCEEPAVEKCGEVKVECPLEKPETVCRTGQVCRIMYDCFGSFEGFVLSDCNNNWIFKSDKKGLEKLLLNACEKGIKITVMAKPDSKSITDPVNKYCPGPINKLTTMR